MRVREKGRTLFENCGTAAGVKVVSNSSVITLDLVATKRLYTARGFFLQYQGPFNLLRTKVDSFLFIFFFFLKSKIEIERAWNSIWTNDCTMNLSSRNNESTNFFFRTQACLTYDIFSLRFLWYVMIWSSLHCDVTIEYYGSFFILEPIRITKLHL